MNLSAIPSLISTILTMGLTTVVLSRHPKNIVGKIFFVSMSSVALIELGSFGILLVNDFHQQLIWARVAMVGACLLPGSWSLFSLTFARRNYRDLVKGWKVIIFLIYLCSWGFLVFLFTSSPLTRGERPEVLFEVTPLGGHFCSFLLVIIVFILFNIESTFRYSKGIRRWQIKFFIFGCFIGFSFYIYVISQILLFPEITRFHLIVGSAMVAVATILISVPLMRYHILGIDIFIPQQKIFKSIVVGAVGLYLLLKP